MFIILLTSPLDVHSLHDKVLNQIDYYSCGALDFRVQTGDWRSSELQDSEINFFFLKPVFETHFVSLIAPYPINIKA